MSLRTWCFAVAIGLVFVGLGQAQEQAGHADRKGETEQDHAHFAPAVIPQPLSVEVFESDAESDARESREQERDQREIEDLIAQRGMNSATQSIEQSTRDMRDYSLYSTVAVCIGTFFLIFTVILTSRATRAAQDAILVTQQIGNDQLRAYIGWNPECFGAANPRYFLFKPPEVVARIPVKNYGQTPSNGAKFKVITESVKGQELCVSEGTLESLPPGCTGIIEHVTTKTTDSSAIKVTVLIEYKTISGGGSTEIRIRSGVSETGKIFSTAGFVDFGQRME